MENSDRITILKIQFLPSSDRETVNHFVLQSMLYYSSLLGNLVSCFNIKKC
ncbi:hypothetical protein NMT12_40112 [metagenome]